MSGIFLYFLHVKSRFSIWNTIIKVPGRYLQISFHDTFLFKVIDPKIVQPKNKQF